MSPIRFGLLLAASTVASSLATPTLAQGCMDKIAELEKQITAKQEGAGPAATGTLGQPSAAGDTSSAPPSAAADNRVPANRPASSDTVAAQKQAEVSATGTQSSAERLPANRPPSAETKAAEAQNSTASGGGSVTPSEMNNAMATLAKAKSLAQQGQEAECLRTVQQVRTAQ